ncbi:MAG TPA: aldo/keto reductase [Ktedonobacterales bacterium]|nr:aldo/keto reductase [Ktedonobacterales bacterium]
MLQTDQRALGASSLVVPALGVGTWSWGDARFWGYGQSHTQDDVTQAYHICLDAGLNFFDTAEGYGGGESERLLGQCRRADGRASIIATKFAPLPWRASSSALLRALDGSLERLGVERIDLYQIHLPPPRLNPIMDALAEAVQSGKVRAVGVSNFSASLMRRAHARLAHHGIPLASNQVQYSLLHRNPEKNGLLDACRELDVTLIAASPLAQGVLSGKFRVGTISRSLTRRIMGGMALGIGATRREKLEPLFLILEEIARAHDKTIAQVALNWLITRDSCIIPIPGAKNVRQASENAGALGWRLTEAEHAHISQAAPLS